MPEPDAAPSLPPMTTEERGETDLFQQALFNLIPFFMDGARGDPARARGAAVELLKAYPIRSVLELQLVTEVIAFSQSALDNLRRAKAEPQMPEVQRDKLRSKAVSLNAAGHRTIRTLEKVYAARNRMPTAPAKPPRAEPPQAEPPRAEPLQAEPLQAESPQAEPQPAPEVVRNQAAILREVQERLAQHRAQIAAQQGGVEPGGFMNRDQRRAAELDARREARRAPV